MHACHQDGVTLALGGLTVVRECDSPKGGVKGIRKLCQLVVRYDGHGGCVRRLRKV